MTQKSNCDTVWAKSTWQLVLRSQEVIASKFEYPKHSMKAALLTSTHQPFPKKSHFVHVLFLFFSFFCILQLEVECYRWKSSCTSNISVSQMRFNISLSHARFYSQRHNQWSIISVSEEIFKCYKWYSVVQVHFQRHKKDFSITNYKCIRHEFR